MDRNGLDVHSLGVPTDLLVDGGTGAGPEPLFENDTDRAPIRRRQTNHEFVLIGPTNPLDNRSACARPSRFHAQSMQVAANANHGTVLQAAPGRQLGPLVGVLIQVPAHPLLTLGEEFVDMRHRIGPAPASGGRHGYDHALDRVDHDAEAP